MCSVTIQQTGSKIIITMNRDESLQRAPEEPPRIWQEPLILAPIDPASAGTWMGVNEGGAWACLLNGYLTESDNAINTPQSRGSLVPQLLASDNPFDFIEEINLSNTRSFRFLAGKLNDVFEYFWDGENLSKNKLASEAWIFRTSSSLKQDEVSEYRNIAFTNWLDDGAEIAANGIPSIHLYNEPDNKEYGVMMQRDYAETKSITQIVIEKSSPAKMLYWLNQNSEKPPKITAFENA